MKKLCNDKEQEVGACSLSYSCCVYRLLYNVLKQLKETEVP